jgi:hypothetical protein
MRLKFTSVLLVIALAGQSFFLSFIQADYIIRYEAYLERCVNKAKPSVKCNGKCQMELKLRQAEQSRQDEEAPVAVKYPEPLFQQVMLPIIIQPLIEEARIITFLADSPMLFRAPGTVFHPPCIG